MKKLIAKKPCSFNGKNFFIGDEIPTDYVLDPKAQEMMGVLVVVEVNSGTADSQEEGSLLPSSSTLEDNTDEDVNQDGTDEQEDEDASQEVNYSKSTLVRMNKEELLSLAADRGIEADAEMKKEDIADLIIQKQGE